MLELNVITQTPIASRMSVLKWRKIEKSNAGAKFFEI